MPANRSWPLKPTTIQLSRVPFRSKEARGSGRGVVSVDHERAFLTLPDMRVQFASLAVGHPDWRDEILTQGGHLILSPCEAPTHLGQNRTSVGLCFIV